MHAAAEQHSYAKDKCEILEFIGGGEFSITILIFLDIILIICEQILLYKRVVHSLNAF